MFELIRYQKILSFDLNLTLTLYNLEHQPQMSQEKHLYHLVLSMTRKGVALEQGGEAGCVSGSRVSQRVPRRQPVWLLLSSGPPWIGRLGHSGSLVSAGSRAVPSSQHTSIRVEVEAVALVLLTLVLLEDQAFQSSCKFL